MSLGWFPFTRLYKGYYSKMQALNLLNREWWLPWANNHGRFCWSFLLSPGADIWGKPLTCHSSVCSSQQNIHHLWEQDCHFLNLSWLSGRPVTGAGRSTNNLTWKWAECVKMVREIRLLSFFPKGSVIVWSIKSKSRITSLNNKVR